MYTSPTIDQSSLLARQQSTLQTNLQNITAVSPPTGGTFWDKANSFLDNLAPVVTKVSTISSQIQQNRVPGTNIMYNPQLQYQQQQANRGNTGKVLLVGGLAILAGVMIYKSVKK